MHVVNGARSQTNGLRIRNPQHPKATTINANSVSEFHYRHHVEAVWVVEGSGTLTNLETGTYPPAVQAS